MNVINYLTTVHMGKGDVQNGKKQVACSSFSFLRDSRNIYLWSSSARNRIRSTA